MLDTYPVLRNTYSMYMGIDIGATKTLIATEDSHGQFIEQKKFSTISDFGRFVAQLQHNLETCTQNQLPESIVVAAPGTVKNGVMHAGGNVSWHDVDLLGCIHETCGNIPMELLNDAAAAGLYEARTGNGRDHEVVLYVTISTGIGSSIVINEQLVGNFANSEGGHMLLDWRHGKTFEHIASGSTFVDMYGHQGKDEADPRIWSQYGEAVAAGLFSMITVIRPSIVVIGGSMGEHFSKYKNTVEKKVADYAGDLFTPPDIVAANKPTTAVAYGSIMRAKEITRG